MDKSNGRSDTSSAVEAEDLLNVAEADFVALEERIMFDGALGAEAVDATVDHATDDAPDTQAEDDANLEAAAAATQAARSEVYFVDSNVSDINDLISSIPDGAEVVVLDAGTDGVEQIASVLEGRSDLSAIHILSHGDSGEIHLGNTTLDATSIEGAHADELAVIASALSADADILIYGCDFGQDAQTLALLSAVTGADVAASDDITGHADLGGDWDLEVTQGEIETETLSAEAWEGELALSNTGDWTPDPGNPNLYENTTAGVTTTVNFEATSANSSFTSFDGTTASLNNIAVFDPTVQDTRSLSFAFYWDTNLEAAADPAATGDGGDGGSGLITIRFDTPVWNPILHLDRIGGSDGTTANGALLTLQTPGVTLAQVGTGTDHFAVNSALGTIQNSNVGSPAVNALESNITPSQGTAAGSVRL